MGEGEYEIMETSKKGRHRKKRLYSSILQQMEFYFSDSNLSKDRFLSQLLKEDPYIALTVFLTFNKIRKLNCTLDDLRKAIGKSELMELSDDREKVRRKVPLKVKENVEECTIYVENIKSDANHDWLTQLFSDFGKVLYVSIPKYKNSKGNKGFAFVEFETEKDAVNALAFFETIGCKMPSETSPEELKSILTFEEATGEVEVEDRPNKRKFTDEDDNKLNKKSKTDDVESPMTNMPVDEENIQETEQNELVEAEPTENKKKKKHKKDKKRNYIKELGLQVLSKHEWKKMRNRYLDLQRKKMKEFKCHLNRQKFNQKNREKNYDRLNKEEDNRLTDETPKENIAKLEFIPGVIVKITLTEPCMDPKNLKNDIKSSSSEVKFVDIPLPSDSNEVFVRFSTNQNAQEFCSKEFTGEKTILEGDEEKMYWQKVQNDRSVKFAKNIKKQRGRDKLLKRAEKEKANHIKFEEADNQ